MRVMFIATGKHTVSDGGQEFEFDNSEGANVANYKNSLVLSDSCGTYITTKYPHMFKKVDEMPVMRPVTFENPGSNFIRLRPTNQPVAPVQPEPVKAMPEDTPPSASEQPQGEVNITSEEVVPPAPKSRIYTKQKPAKGI